MSYRFKIKNNIESEIQRIACEQIDKAIGEIDDPALDRHEAVHQVRKRCKKIRALLRTARPNFESTYQKENTFFRDAARTLSELRDTEALLETYDALMEHFAGQIERPDFATVRRQLTLRKQHLAEETLDLDQRLADFRAAMVEAKDRLESWSIKPKAWAALEDGVLKTYRRGRDAMDAAYQEPSAENFHEWRKRVKYHRYHVRLLRDVWKPIMNEWRKELKTLSDYLGDEHDLAVFRQTIAENPDDFGGEQTIQALLGLVDARRAQLQELARPLGMRIYAEKPKALGKRLASYWIGARMDKKNEPILADSVHPTSTAAS